MGGSSSSSSSRQETTQITETTTITALADQRVGASSGGIAAGANSRQSINFIQTADGAFELADAALDTVSASAAASHLLADNAVTGVFDFADEVVEEIGQSLIARSFDLAEATTGLAQDLVEAKAQTETQTLARDALKLTIPVAVVVGIAFVLRRA